MKKIVMFLFVAIAAIALVPQTANAQTDKKVATEKAAKVKAKKGEVVPIDQNRQVKKTKDAAAPASVRKEATQLEAAPATKKKPAEAVIKPIKKKAPKNKKPKKLERIKKIDN